MLDGATQTLTGPVQPVICQLILFGFLRFEVILQTAKHKRSRGHGLTNAVEIESVGVKPDNLLKGFGNVVSIKDFSFLMMSIKDYIGTTYDVSFDRVI